MARLNMVIADNDESYGKGLSQYIGDNHSQIFSISYFTNHEALIHYLEQHSIDIFLVSPEFYDIASDYARVCLKVILTPGLLDREYPGFQPLNKYCTGEKLVSDVIYLYSQHNPNAQKVSPQLQNTKLIGVYSAAGGTGKTTIAAALSMKCGELGKRGFFLSLESIQSTDIFFKSEIQRSISYVFYYIKENCKNLSFKMAGIKSMDSEYEVQYFQPPDSAMDYADINKEEAAKLIQGIKEMGCCEYIFMDMPNTIDAKNLRLLELCDSVVYVTIQNPVAFYKDRLLFDQMAKLYGSSESSLLHKFILVANKCEDSHIAVTTEVFAGAAAPICIPAYKEAFINEKKKLVISDEVFSNSINRLIDIITVD